jgi:hypothetical protein
MEVSYIPKVCKDEDATFSGSIKLKVPGFDERYQFMEDSGIDVGDDGGIQKKSGNFAILRKMVKGSQKFYVGVELKKLSDGKEYKSFEELCEDPDCDPILIEIAGQIRSGFNPGPK